MTAPRTKPSFEDVYRDRRPHLVRLAYLMVRSHAVAEELVHDGFIRLHDNFDDVDNPAGFLHTAVVRLCLTWSSRRTMERERLTRIAAPDRVDDEPDELWDALGRIEPGRRAVLVLRYYADLEHSQIAEVLGIPVATVRTRAHRGLAELRKEMGHG